jgi:SAM-dependent methyltransferase
MPSLEVRERAEKIRSSFEASQTTTPLLMSAQTVARYFAPSETTAFPLEYAYHLLGDVTGKTVLEFGCGDGMNTVMLAKRGAKVIAFDISAELVALAAKRVEANGCRGVEFVLASAHTLPLKDESVDVVFGMAILHHLDLELASQQVRRVLKNGGRAIFKEPLRNSKLLAWIRQFFPRRPDVSPFERPLTDEEIRTFGTPYIRRARTFHLPSSSIAGLLPFWSGQASQLCARVERKLLGRFPSLTYYGTVKVFEMVKDENPGPASAGQPHFRQTDRKT